MESNRRTAVAVEGDHPVRDPFCIERGVGRDDGAKIKESGRWAIRAPTDKRMACPCRRSWLRERVAWGHEFGRNGRTAVAIKGDHPVREPLCIDRGVGRDGGGEIE